MRKILLTLFILISSYTYGQHRSFVQVEDSAIVQHNEITIKPLSQLSSAKEAPGREDALFEVVDAEDTKLIGKKVIAKVVDVHKSNMSGAGGTLTIRPLYIDNNGTPIELLPDDLYFKGLNRTNIKICTFFTIVSLFIPGGGAKVSTSENFKARIIQP